MKDEAFRLWKITVEGTGGLHIWCVLLCRYHYAASEKTTSCCTSYDDISTCSHDTALLRILLLVALGSRAIIFRLNFSTQRVCCYQSLLVQILCTMDQLWAYPKASRIISFIQSLLSRVFSNPSPHEAIWYIEWHGGFPRLTY